MRRSILAALACAIAVPLLVVACKKPQPEVVDAGPPPAPTDAAPAEIQALDDTDAGVDAGEAPKPKTHTGPAMNANQARAKQCCAALRSQAKQLGASPEANMLLGFAATCDQLAMQVGPTSGGQAPELEPLRQLLKGKTLPGVCQGL